MSNTQSTSSTNHLLTAGRLPRGSVWYILVGSWIASASFFGVLQLAGITSSFSAIGTAVCGTLLFDVVAYVVSRLIEGRRKALDRLVTSLVVTAFVLALLPLISLGFTVIAQGAPRLDIEFVSSSMRNVLGSGGGVLHAIIGTLEITAVATLISVPIGLLTAIYLVEYGRGQVARLITIMVDVMTGIPPIVAGLFAYALFAVFFGPGVRSGFIGAIALSVLMIPIVVRSSEEILRLTPNELREASYALGVPKWLTIVKIVLPTSLAGITTGVTLAVARVIGETAPLLLTAGYTASMNYNIFDDRMATLPVYVYLQYSQQGPNGSDFINRAWTGALILILIVALLNLIARVVARVFSPKRSR